MILDDIRYALRQFAKSPGFTATAILTLALGIGATTAIFTLVYSILLKSLPVADPAGLIRIGNNESCCINGGMQEDWSLFSYEQYKEFRDNTPGFSQLAAFQAGETQVGVRREGSNHPAESFHSGFVSGNAFDTLGIKAYAGRLLRQSDDDKGAPPVAVMSYRTWLEKFGQDPTVVGANFLINGYPFTILGITPPGFFGEKLTTDPPSFWMPLNKEPMVLATNSVLEEPDLDWLNLIGRLQLGASQKETEARLQVELRQFLQSPISKTEERSKSLIPKQTLHLAPGGGGVQRMQDEIKDKLHLLMWISGFVLLIACANLANLMLARATTHRQRISIQAALGAARSRLVGQALTESIVLALLGGVVSLGVAYGGARLILHLASGKSYVPIDVTPSPAVLGFAFVVSLLTGVVFGVAPAWVTAHADPIDALRDSTRTVKRSGMWTQKALVIVQAAVSLMLLCAAALLAQSLRNLHHRDFGFDTANRYILHIDPLMAGYKITQVDALYRELHDTLAAIPGVKAVAYSTYSPMEGDNWGTTVYFEGRPAPPPGSNEQNASWVCASPAYFDVIGTRLIAGRPITEQDTATTRNIAVVNQEFVKRFYKNQNPIGQHFGTDDQKYSGSYEIVGITENTDYWQPDSKLRPMYFLSTAQRLHIDDPDVLLGQNFAHMHINAWEIQTSRPIPGLESQVRNAVAQINPNLTVISFETFARQVQENFNEQAMVADLTSLFGFLALILASIGLYGVTAYTVAQRTSEIGLRMALGANRTDVLRMVLRGAFLLVGVGLAVGLLATVLVGRFMASQLFGVKASDPLILLITTLILAAAALVASLIPAQRAASIEPMHALRTE